MASLGWIFLQFLSPFYEKGMSLLIIIVFILLNNKTYEYNKGHYFLTCNKSLRMLLYGSQFEMYKGNP